MYTNMLNAVLFSARSHFLEVRNISMYITVTKDAHKMQSRIITSDARDDIFPGLSLKNRTSIYIVLDSRTTLQDNFASTNSIMPYLTIAHIAGRDANIFASGA